MADLATETAKALVLQLNLKCCAAGVSRLEDLPQDSMVYPRARSRGGGMTVKQAIEYIDATRKF